DLPFATAYLDDILVASVNEQEHHEHLQQVLQKLSEYSLKLKPQKCEFFRTKVNFVGVEKPNSPSAAITLPAFSADG
ncbi:MAG: reverse transcriptase domain-containing protein, partial [Acidobacteriota bacterium]